VSLSLQATKTAKSAVQTQTIFWAEVGAPEPRCWAITLDDTPLRADETSPEGSPSANGFVDIGAFELVRRFVEHVAAKNVPGEAGDGRLGRVAVDWETVAASVADSRSLEHAIGRAVVVADQMARGVFDDSPVGDAPSLPDLDEPFFAFTMADVVPDFGDDSYRTRVARMVARIIRIRRTVVTPTVWVVLVLLCVALSGYGAR
jgi:hypothetical protein